MELKRCECGSEDVRIVQSFENKMYSAYCWSNLCERQSLYTKTPQEAINAWNKSEVK